MGSLFRDAAGKESCPHKRPSSPIRSNYTMGSATAGAGVWRKPRMKIYDYNQEFGGNYYQPMIEYINNKDIMGMYHERKEVYMPERAEVTSDKYTNMRYNDKSSTNVDLDDFLVKAYAKQIKELNSSTAKTHRLAMHNKKEDTFLSNEELLGHFVMADGARKHYTNQLASKRRLETALDQRQQREAEERALAKAKMLAEAEAYAEKYGYELKETLDHWALFGEYPPIPPGHPLTEEEKFLINNARSKIYWRYQPKNFKEWKQWLV